MSKQALKPAASAGSKARKSTGGSSGAHQSNIGPRSQPRTSVKTTPTASGKATHKRPDAASGKRPLGGAIWGKASKEVADAPSSQTPTRRGCLSSLLPILLIVIGLAVGISSRQH